VVAAGFGQEAISAMTDNTLPTATATDREPGPDARRPRGRSLLPVSGLGRRRALVAVRVAFGLAWATDASLKWLPAFANHTFLGTIKGERAGQPEVVKDWINLWVGAIGSDPNLFAHILAVAESLIAIFLIVGAFTNLVCFLGSFLSLGIWTVGEGLGGPYMNGSTDISASIIYVMMFVVLAAMAAGAYGGVDAWLRPRLGRMSWLCSRRQQE
jgi:nitrite reductase (NO-forming)